MCEFNSSLVKSEYDSYSDKKMVYLNDLADLIVASNEALEGNSFYYDRTLNLFPELYAKQQNLFWCGKQAETRICEIGFNAGHSTLLMLLGRENTPLNYTIFDIGHHAYTKPCVKYIESKFQHVAFEYIEGDSTITMPKWISENSALLGTYDVVHVDGGHSEECISNDMKNTDILVKVNGIVIVDDTSSYHISKYVDICLASGRYKELPVLHTSGYTHRIIQKIQ
jgi:hypothetical protein